MLHPDSLPEMTRQPRSPSDGSKTRRSTRFRPKQTAIRIIKEQSKDRFMLEKKEKY